MIHIKNEIVEIRGKTYELCVECAAALTQVGEMLAQSANLTTAVAIMTIAEAAISALPEWEEQKNTAE